jgi:hypothetical protein
VGLHEVGYLGHDVYNLSYNCITMAQESALIAQRCEEAKGSGDLLLNNCGLRKFPDAIFFLMREVELRSVNLSHNQLHKLTPKLGSKFTSITGEFRIIGGGGGGQGAKSRPVPHDGSECRS